MAQVQRLSCAAAVARAAAGAACRRPFLASFSGTAPAARAARQEAEGGGAPQALRRAGPVQRPPAAQSQGRLVVSLSFAEVWRAFDACALLA